MSVVDIGAVTELTMFAGRSNADIQWALDLAGAAVEGYCERSFGEVLGDVVVVDPRYGNGGLAQAMLPNPPVLNLGKLEAQIPIDGALTWVTLSDYNWTEDGLVYDISRYMGYNGVTGSSFWPAPTADGVDYSPWPQLPRSLRATYDHGYTADSLPDGVRTAVIAAAMYFIENPLGAVDLRTGDVSTKWDLNARVAGILDGLALAPYRLVTL